ncbi:uncharacterized protein BX664DRAFT_339443 [Halteromyces radiatus]|uniref:uncharacterized protein n=1 Tax=Halteromyces radiatus TaxID=101107 RepID=UPI002220892E|nr:uncharacterized protein BX664DRAFT_339443 [Halteromyces radiatus]KAI8082938.1 hypothetical protein BX664DRAFT_339443 [Halteromyces radiatus]
MDNIDDYILQLADKDTSSKSTSKSSRKSSSRKYASDSDEVYSDDDDIDIGSEGEIDEYGPDLYKDEEDRKRLLALPEVEREHILSERSEERQRNLERLEVRKLLKDGHRGDTTRRSTRSKGSGTSRALSELTRRREEKKSSRSIKRHRRYSPSPEKKKRRRSSHEEHSDYEHSEEWPESDEEREAKAKKRAPTLEEIQSISFTRNMIEQWLYTPFFDDTAIGCFVRLYIGPDPAKKVPVYRMCQVVDVAPWHKVYKISDGVFSNRGLKVKYGKSEKVFPMDIISNQPVTQSEYTRLLNVLESERLRAPTMDHVEQKLEDLKKAKAYVLNHEEVSDMIARKRQVQGQNVSVAMERAEVLARLEHAKGYGDADEISRLTKRLQSLDELVDRGGNSGSQQHIWEEINKRNRERDRIESQEVELRLSEERRKAIKLAMLQSSQQSSEIDQKSETKNATVIVVASYEKLMRSLGKELAIEFIDE